MKATVQQFLGFQSNVVTAEKLVAAIGGVLAIVLTAYVSGHYAGSDGRVAILPSMGAATVLLFAVPHGQLSTPWALLGGNILSAAVGVTAVSVIDQPHLAAGVAVGASILVMHLARCLHPPGGATALAFALGGDQLQALGYGYVVFPTLINCCIIFSVAMIFNNLFYWRRYPLSLMRYTEVPTSPGVSRIQPRHIHEAIARSEVVMDISDDQVKRIVDLADQIMRLEAMAGFEFEVGAFYTNGKPGSRWAVRQVVDERAHPDPSKYMVIFRTVEGAKKGMSDSCSLQEFAEWSREKMRPRKQ